jgi:NADPH2:quinone reductase
LYDRARLQPGHTVLIHAGAGGVGHVAIQLAKLHGARVIATVGSSDKASFVRDLGADEIIDYRATDFAAAVNDLTEGAGADVVFDTVGPAVFQQSIGCTAHFGDLVTLLDLRDTALGEARMRNLRIGFELMLTPMLRHLHAARDHQIEILNRCSEWIEQGRLRIHVAQTFPLAEAPAAHTAIEEGHTTGKLVLSIP